jgi:hypothetical protein
MPMVLFNRTVLYTKNLLRKRSVQWHENFQLKILINFKLTLSTERNSLNPFLEGKYKGEGYGHHYLRCVGISWGEEELKWECCCVCVGHLDQFLLCTQHVLGNLINP